MVFREGMIATISGMKGPIAVEGRGSLEVNGKNVQLLSKDERGTSWTVMTFDGSTMNIEEESLSLMKAEVLKTTDIVIGPSSKEDVVSEAIMSALIEKGYCVSQSIMPHAAVSEMLDLTKDLEFGRSPAEFEPFYLGRDSKEKTVLLDFEAEDTKQSILDSAYKVQDGAMGDLYATLAPELESRFGMRITSRTNLMVRQTFVDDDEAADYIAMGEPTNAERENFLTLMKRKRVCMMQFLGPLTSTLTLIPKKGSTGVEEVSIQAQPGMMVLFLNELYQYSHTCEGRTTTLQSWFLSQRPEFSLEAVTGDMEVLGAIQKGADGPKGETVAVNGISTIIGGDSKDYICFWLLANKGGGDTFVQTPISRWDINTYCLTHDMQAAQMNGLSYTCHQGYVDGIEMFDAKFFGISNTEASSMDPNQRKTMECTYELLVMGGHDLKQLQRTSQHIGAFIGTSGIEWNSVPHPTDSVGCGGHDAILSNRVNFSMNLKGASQTINTACSAGLVAMHTGKLHLKYKDYDPLTASLCCGINLAYSPFPFIGCCGGAMLSYKGRSFTFDVSADGYGRGEGCSGVYLNIEEYSKSVFALVAGSQSNQDGRSASITAPNGPSQEKCIKAAFKEAGLKPPEADCFECHGTGTALGDPIEVGAFKRIYNSAERKHSLIVTTSKTNLGHLEGGAGMAGFIKCCLQVMKCEGSPNLHLRETNPHLDTEGFPAQFTTEPMTFEYKSGYSGVSSFGFGGTNSHAMAYGTNTTTSRGNSRDFRSQMRDKIAQAPPPEILTLGDSPEEWESTGMPVTEDKIGKTFQVEVSEGKTVWREVMVPPPATFGERFYLSASWNGWGMEPMKEVEDMPDLYECEVTIGPDCEEYFHIIADEDYNMSYFPSMPRCTRKVADVMGPSSTGGMQEDASWCIQAPEGTRFKVEFYVTKALATLNWIRIKDTTAAISS
mmetsp:Transcript_65865/g.140935  ORF Transcript_65865/g.140935 Transcript_65865/m.140935 type:complete len:945 (+) Transcript_65865:73-2907(+)